MSKKTSAEVEAAHSADITCVGDETKHKLNHVLPFHEPLRPFPIPSHLWTRVFFFDPWMCVKSAQRLFHRFCTKRSSKRSVIIAHGHSKQIDSPMYHMDKLCGWSLHEHISYQCAHFFWVPELANKRLESSKNIPHPCLIRKWTEGQKFKTLVWAQAFSQKFEERLRRNIHFCAACILQRDLCNVSFHLVQYTLSGAWNATVMGICRIRLAQIKTCSKCAQLIEIQLSTEVTEVHKCDSGRFRKGSFWDEHLIWSDRSVTVVCSRISIHVIYLSASGWYMWVGNGWQLAIWNTTKFTRLL